MATLGWFGKGKAEKAAKRFTTLVREGDAAAACAAFEQDLPGDSSDVEPVVRALYHFLHWNETGEARHWDAVRQLAASRNAQDAIAQTFAVMERLQFRKRIAAAIKQRNAANLKNTPGFSDAVPLELLGLAVVDWLRHADKDQTVKRVSESILAKVPPITALKVYGSDALVRVRGRLASWAYWTLGRSLDAYNALFAAGSLPPNAANDALLAAIVRQGRDAITKGVAKDAIALLEPWLPRLTIRQIGQMTVFWGRAILESQLSAGFAVKWLSVAHSWFQSAVAGTARGMTGEMNAWSMLIRLAWACATLKTGDSVEGRKLLDRVRSDAADSDTEFSACELGVECADVVAQCHWMCALSMLAEMAAQCDSDDDYSTDDDEPLEDRRMFWTQRLPRLQALAESAADKASELAWQGQLLGGLLAYIDSGIQPTAAQMEGLKDAGSKLESKPARARIALFESALMTRSQATDQAAEMIRKKQIPELRQFYERVLAPLNESVPVRLLASIWLALWDADPAFDALGRLRRLTQTDGEAADIDACIRLIQTVSELRKLTAACKLQDGVKRAESAAWLEDDPGLKPLVVLARAVVQLQAGNASAALNKIREYAPDSTTGPALDAAAQYARFYAAWTLQDYATCQDVLAGSCVPPQLARMAGLQTAIFVRDAGSAIQLQQDEKVVAFLFSADTGVEELEKKTIALTVMQIKDGAFAAGNWLANVVKKEVLARAKFSADERQRLLWVLAFLRGVCSCGMGHYAAVTEAFTTVLETPPPSRSALGGPAEHTPLAGWAKFFCAVAELAAAATSLEDPRPRWISVRRAIDAHLSTLTETPKHQDYGALIAGLVSYVSSDKMVDDNIVAPLERVRQALPMSQRAALVDRIIGNLRGRQEVLKAFWSALKNGFPVKAAGIYHKEILPAYGADLPGAIRAAMLVAEAIIGTRAASELKVDLSNLERDVPSLSRDLIAQIRNTIDWLDALRRLSKLLKRNQFEELLELCKQPVWRGTAASSAAPELVRLTLLFACFKKKLDETTARGKELDDDSRLNPWVKNAGHLILGYHLFDQKDFPKAALEFELIDSPTFLGHDRDLYFSVAHFSHGSQLLSVDKSGSSADKNSDMLDAFSKAFNGKAKGAFSDRLAPLFLHLGRKKLEASDGKRALRAFEILHGGEVPAGQTPIQRYERAAAQVGRLICGSFKDKPSSDPVPSGKEALDLLTQFDPSNELPADQRNEFEGKIRLFAICLEFRFVKWQTAKSRSQSNDRKEKIAGLVKFMHEQLDLLRKLPPPHYDPSLLVLRGMLACSLDEKIERINAFEYFVDAKKLGIDRPKVNAVMESISQKHKDDASLRKGALDLFDLYLQAGQIPAEAREKLARDDQIAVMYRVSRGYRPTEILMPPLPPASKILSERLEKMLKFAGETAKLSGANKTELEGHKKAIDEATQVLIDTETKLLDAEKTVLKLIARALSEHDLSRIVIGGTDENDFESND